MMPEGGDDPAEPEPERKEGKVEAWYGMENTRVWARAHR